MTSDISLTEFIDSLVKKTELGKPLILQRHQRIILDLAYEMMMLWATLIYSTIKKSGKTLIEALWTLWWAHTHDDDELYLAANDLEQSLGRGFKVIKGLIRHNPKLKARVYSNKIVFRNGTEITALASEYAGAAGSNHGCVGWDELWAYTSERSMRLWDELTPVPNKPSVRIVTTYAGWEGESALLWELYRQGVGKDEHLDGKAERIHPELPIYLNKENGIFCYWDHEPRMPWQTEDYYRREKLNQRPGAYLRLHENRWSTAEETFITPELWDPCVDHSLSPLLPTREHALFIGVDAAIKHDTAAVIAMRWDGEKLALASHRVWKPSPAAPLNLEDTIEAYLRELYSYYNVKEILCDPWQLHRSITALQDAHLPIREFPQTTQNTTLMGQTLFDLLKGKNIKFYVSEEIRSQALNTVAIESLRGWRIAKEKASKKIDAIVALAMACVAAVEGGRPKPINPLAYPRGIGRDTFVSTIQRMDAISPQISFGGAFDEEDEPAEWEVFKFEW